MKASELIKLLQQRIEENGDFKVKFYDGSGLSRGFHNVELVKLVSEDTYEGTETFFHLDEDWD